MSMYKHIQVDFEHICLMLSHLCLIQLSYENLDYMELVSWLFLLLAVHKKEVSQPFGEAEIQTRTDHYFYYSHRGRKI